MILGRAKSLSHSLIVSGAKGGGPGESDFGGWGGGTGDTTGTGLGPAGGGVGSGAGRGDAYNVGGNIFGTTGPTQSQEEAAQESQTIAEALKDLHKDMQTMNPKDAQAQADLATKGYTQSAMKAYADVEALAKRKGITFLEALGEAAENPSTFGFAIAGLKGLASVIGKSIAKNNIAKDFAMTNNISTQQAKNVMAKIGVPGFTFSATNDLGNPTNDSISSDISDYGMSYGDVEKLSPSILNSQPIKEYTNSVIGNSTPTTEASTETSKYGDSWTKFQDAFFGDNNNAQSLIQDHADHLAKYGQDYANTLTTATNKQNMLLDDLTGQSQSGTGLFKPFTFSMLGQDVSFAPRANREQATQQAGFGQQGLQNTMGMAEGILNTSNMTSPSAGGLGYLDALQGVAGTEEAMRQYNQDLAFKREALEKGILDNTNRANLNYAINSRQLDQKEPGWSDYLGEAAKIFDSLFGSE